MLSKCVSVCIDLLGNTTHWHNGSSSGQWFSHGLNVPNGHNTHTHFEMNDSNDIFTTKRIINHRTKQIETRIQRQIVIEDGKVVSDTGPLVTTKTLEDSKEEIDEVEHKYAYGQRASGASWSENSNENACSNKPLKKFMFGFDGGQASESPVQSDVTNNREQKFQKCHDENNHQKTSKSATDKPRNYFYFGQNTNYHDVKEKENVQVDNRTGKNKIANDDHHLASNEAACSTEEQDCQFAYEYHDFSCNGKDRT